MKHSSLSVSADGRDLTFNGQFLTLISYLIHVFIAIQDRRPMVTEMLLQPEQHIPFHPHVVSTTMKFPSSAKVKKGNYLQSFAELQSSHCSSM